jgi:predicted thioesterase
MKDAMAVGMTRKQRFEIDSERTISFMGEELAVYATPFMVRDVERTCRELIDEFLDAEENSVGTHVEIDHLGPTLNGMWVDVEATISEVDGRLVTFNFEVRDALDVVGRGMHKRFIVALDRQRARLEDKRKRAGLV